MPRPRGAKPGKDGYVRGVRGPAGSKRVAEHRAVLLEALGPDPVPCHWGMRGCVGIVRWEAVWPKDRDALIPDHLNQDKADNRVENLVPSCYRCNSRRTAN